MLEMIIDKLPTLAKIETTVAALEQKHGEASARVQSLAHKTAQAREDDLNREAAALNAGRAAPKPTEPALQEQAQGAVRDLEVSSRRLALAQGEKARYLAEHHATILGLLAEAHAAEGERVAAAAEAALEALLAYHRAEDAARNLQRSHPAPAQENTGGPEAVSIVFGNLTTNNAGGANRGALEGTLRQLISLGAPTIVVEGGGEDGEDAA